MFNDHQNRLFIENKKEKLKAWCQKNNTSVNELVNQFIVTPLNRNKKERIGVFRTLLRQRIFKHRNVVTTYIRP
jgi:hypothetical protein